MRSVNSLLCLFGEGCMKLALRFVLTDSLPLKSVVDTPLALAVDFIWSPATKQMISKQLFYIDKCRDG